MKILNRNLLVGLAALAFVFSASAQDSGEVPRMADGKPDLSGVWWTGGDLGSAGYGSTTDRSAGLQYNLYTDL